MYRLLTAAAAALISLEAGAASYVLDFRGNGVVPETFGDNAEVDLAYRAISSLSADPAWGDGIATTGGIAFWNTGYGDLDGAAWGQPNPSRGEIRITAVDPSDVVAIDSFDLGGWSADEAASWRVFDLAWNALDAGTGVAPNTNGRLSVAPAASAQGGLIFQWGDDAWDVGLQNFAFSVGTPSTPAIRVTFTAPNPPPTVVPVPAAAPLLAVGAALCGWLGARRRG